MEECKYFVKVTVYGGEERTLENLSWDTAIAAYDRCPRMPFWTRHSTVDGEVRHMDFCADLFNEASIVLDNMSRINKY
jgi:hypothetical protein